MNCDLKTFHVPIAFFDYTIKKYFTNNIYYMYNIIQLNDKDLSELQSIAKELGITKTESLKKEELVYKILDEQAIVGATKKVAAAKVNEDRKENQPKKRSRISVKKEGDKVYTATKDKAQKLEAATPTTAAHIAEEAEKEVVSTVETAQPIQEKTVTEAVEKSEPKKRGRKPGTKNKTAAKTEEQPATTAEETNNTTPQKVSATNTPKEKEVILPELDFDSDTDDFIPIEDLPKMRHLFPLSLQLLNSSLANHANKTRDTTTPINATIIIITTSVRPTITTQKAWNLHSNPNNRLPSVSR